MKVVSAVLWFCEGEPLKFGIGHMDSGEPIYSVYNLEKDDSSIWGFGFPSMMRDSQAAMNGAWRMMMDNSGLSSGPQIVVDKNAVEPSDGDWTLLPRKIWLRKTDATGKAVFDVHNIDSHQAELANIIALAKQFIDDETAISVLAQGEQGAHTTQTSSGMALLMNAVNVVFRRMVKNFDDDMTVPNIRRLYDWNMQFSPKQHIKGDFEVDARGTSVLLVREIQSQNLLVLLNFVGHPVLGMLLKAAAILRKLGQSMMIPADEIIKTDEEVRTEAEAMAKNPPPPDPSFAAAKLRADTDLRLAEINRETAMLTLAEKLNMNEGQVRAMLAKARMDNESKERMLATEVAVEERNSKRAAAAGAMPTGSGGSISAGAVNA